MKFSLNLSLFLFALLIFGEKSLSLSDHQISKICQKKIKKSTCKKYYQEKKFNLQKGNVIEIPVIRYKR